MKMRKLWAVVALITLLAFSVPAIATVSTTTNRVVYSGNGSTTVFPYTFEILDEDDIVVILRTVATGAETTLTKTTHYSVSGVGTVTGGNVTTVSTYSSAYQLILLRSTEKTQETDFVENDPFQAETSEQALDKLTLMVQDINEELDRSLRVSPGSSLTGTAMEITPVASKAIGFDATATGLTTYDTVTTDGINDTHIDWGTGANQVSADDIPDGVTNIIPTAVQETNWDTAYGWGDHAAAGYVTSLTSVADDSITPAKLADADFGDFTVSSNVASLDAGVVGATELASTAVTGGTYGSATQVPQFTVDADGRLTAAANVTITGGHAAVTLSTDAGANLLALSTQEIGLDDQAANTVFAGPDAAPAAAPGFRALVAADIPHLSNLITLSGVAADAVHLGSFTGSTITDNITIKAAVQELETAFEALPGGHDAVTLGSDGVATLLDLSTQELQLDTQAPNFVFAGPYTGTAPGDNDEPTFRALVAADIPDISATYQPLDTDLTAIAALTSTGVGNFIVGSAGGWVAESGNTARTSLGLGTGNSPQFTAIELGHATDTTIAQAGAGIVTIEGSNILTAATGQPLDADLTAIAGLSNSDSNFIVGSATGWVAESGTTARTSLGVGTGDSPQFTGIELGNASDSTITRVSAGLLAIEGSNILTAATGQGLDADLTAIAGLASSDGNFIVGSATGWVAESGATALTSIGAQAADADLTTWAGITPSADVQTVVGSANMAAIKGHLSVDDLVTLSGVADGAVNLGTFTGTTVSDSITIKAAIQEIETAFEALPGGHTEVTLGADGVADLLDLSTQELQLDTQAPNYVFAGPDTGTAPGDNAEPTFRALVAADIPSLSSVYQPLDSDLTKIAGLTSTGAGTIMVGSGAGWVVESGSTARTSLGLGTGNSPQFTSIELGSATGTTIAEAGAGIVTIEGKYVMTSTGALTPTDNYLIVGNGTTWATEQPSDARTSLGLGTIATQASSSVSITGGSITGITDLAVADGGTGASSLTSNSIVIGQGSSALTVVANPGASGRVLVSGTGTGAPQWTSTPTIDSMTINNATVFTLEGASADASETTISVVDPTADRTIYIPNDSGYIALGSGHAVKFTTSGTTAITLPTSGTMMVNPMTTNGDILYGAASGTPTRLAAGSAGQVLKISGGVPAWGADTDTNTTYTAGNGLTLSTTTFTLGDITTNTSIAQTTYTLTRTYTGTTGVGYTYQANSLTSGSGMQVSSSSTAGSASGSSKSLYVTRSGTNSNASHTASAIYASATNTGTTSTNVAVNAYAIGATTNYAFYGTGQGLFTHSVDTSSDWYSDSSSNLRLYNSHATGDAVLKMVGATTARARIVFGTGTTSDNIIFSSRQKGATTSDTITFDYNGQIKQLDSTITSGSGWYGRGGDSREFLPAAGSEGGTKLSMYDTDTTTRKPMIYGHRAQATSAGYANRTLIPTGIHQSASITGSDAYNNYLGISSYVYNAMTGNEADAVAVAGRVQRYGNTTQSDSCGVWGSAYIVGTTSAMSSASYYVVQGLEGHIYVNGGTSNGTEYRHNTTSFALGNHQSTALHVGSWSTNQRATAAVYIDATSTGGEFGSWNGVYMSPYTFYGTDNTAATGTVAINMGAFTASYYPENYIVMGYSGGLTDDQYNIYSTNDFKMTALYSHNEFIRTAGVSYYWRWGVGTPSTYSAATDTVAMTLNAGTSNVDRNLTMYGSIVMPELSSAPDAPLANSAKLYVRDNGSGKTQLVVVFNGGGAVQVLATQP